MSEPPSRLDKLESILHAYEGRVTLAKLEPGKDVVHLFFIEDASHADLGRLQQNLRSYGLNAVVISPRAGARVDIFELHLNEPWPTHVAAAEEEP